MKTLIVAVILASPAIWGQSANRAVPDPAPPAPAPVAPTPVAPTPVVAPAKKDLIDKAVDLISPANPQPLNARQRFNLYVVNTIGPFAIISEGAIAGVQQWRDSPHEWGQGGSGYAHRFWNNMAYNGVRQTISYGLSEVLHEDNRYFESKNRSVKGRILHVVTSPARARRRDGRDTVSISSLSGIAGAAAISQAWAPPSWRGGDSFASNFAWTYAGAVGINAVREFVPGFVRRFHK